MEKKLINVVWPGDDDVLALDRVAVDRDGVDLPTFDRPMKAISGLAD